MWRIKETFSRIIAHLTANALTYVSSVVASVFVGVPASFASYKWGNQNGQTNAQQQCQMERDSEATILTNHIGRMLRDAAEARSDEDLLIKVHALLSVRDDLRRQLAEISSSVNGDFDRVETEANDFAASLARSDSVKNAYLRNAVAVLAQKWPAKRAQLEAAVRSFQRRGENQSTPPR